MLFFLNFHIQFNPNCGCLNPTDSHTFFPMEVVIWGKLFNLASAMQSCFFVCFFLNQRMADFNQILQHPKDFLLVKGGNITRDYPCETPLLVTFWGKLLWNSISETQGHRPCRNLIKPYPHKNEQQRNLSSPSNIQPIKRNHGGGGNQGQWGSGILGVQNKTFLFLSINQQHERTQWQC